MKLHHIISLLLLACLSGCMEPVTEFERYRVIANESTHEVTVEVKTDVEFLQKLSPGSATTIWGTCYDGPGAEYCQVGWDELQAVSGRIVFDGERQLLFTSVHCTGTRNLLASPVGNYQACGYTERTANGRQELVYTITDEDYEMAEPF